ncbi:MAG: hypothetical protein AAF907_10330, partial [Planctomycetota bacterium]
GNREWPESGSEESPWLILRRGQTVHESGSEWAESGSGTFGGRPDPFGGWEPGVIAPPPRPSVQRGSADGRAGLRSAPPGGGWDEENLPSDSGAGPPPGDPRVHALLVSLGWLAALVAGGVAGYLLGLGRGAERRQRSLEPRQLDLAGEVVETADSLMAAAAAEEAGRFGSCVDRLRERVGRTAVLLDDRSAEAVRRLVADATDGVPDEPMPQRAARLQPAYDALVTALRRSVRGA